MGQPSLEPRINRLEQARTRLEVARAGHDARMIELERWRRRDEPRIAQLSTAAEVASAVREALDEHRARSWGIWHKAAATLAGAVVAAGALLDVLRAAGVG